MWLNRKQIKKRIAFDVQRGKCWLCLRPMQMSDHTAEDYATWDEVTPRSRGGRRRKINQALAHASCNHAKGSDLPTETQLANLREMRRAAQVV